MRNRFAIAVSESFSVSLRPVYVSLLNSGRFKSGRWYSSASFLLDVSSRSRPYAWSCF